MDKALLVAIGDYGSLSQKRLDGAPEALRTWKALLTEFYGFRAGDPANPTVNLHTLESRQATKQSILRELRWLAVASSNDRLVFIFDGHGTSTNRRFPTTGPPSATYVEQGLVTYPEPNDTLETATLFGDEIVGAVGGTSANVLCVIDACHAQGVLDGTGGPLQPQSLFIDARAFGFDSSASRFRLMTLLERLVGPSFDAARPSIVVAAATEAETAAYEVTINGVRQMLFSYKAAQLLDQHPEHTYKSLYAILVHQLTIQTPILDGDRNRKNNQFTY